MGQSQSIAWIVPQGGDGPSYARRPPDGADAPNPDYDLNDAALPSGASYWARLAERLLPAR